MSSVTPQLEIPIVQVDHEHWQNSSSNGVEPLEYSVNSNNGFVLSTNGYSFVIPEAMGFREPNIIQVILGKDRLYAMAYEAGETEYTVAAGNLVALYGSPAFSGFEHGQKVIVAIGHLTPAGDESPQPKFIVLWVGVVNIE